MAPSPVESCNKALRHGSHLIHSNTKLDTSCGRVLNGADSKIQHGRNDAEREMLCNNHSSHGKTKVCLIKKGQALVDNKHDAYHTNVFGWIVFADIFGISKMMEVVMTSLFGHGLKSQNLKK